MPVRLYASKDVHRLVPAPLALAIATSIGPMLRQRRNPAELADAERFMRDLLWHTPRAGEAEALAKEWLKEKSRLRELFWRPWLLKRSKIYGREHWVAARKGGLGCVIVFGHIVAAWAPPAILALHGYDLYGVVSPHYWRPMPPGYEGLATLHRRREYAEKPLGTSRLILSDSSPGRMLELLAAGESIAIAFDVPGWAATPFLGRNIALGGGTASLPFKSRARVLPVIPERHGARLDLRMLPPLDPADYPDVKALRTAIARTFEPLVVSRPETVELPWIPSPLLNEVPPPRSANETERAP